MNKLFIDTSGWASLFVTQEPFHDRTSQLFNQAIQKRQPLITSNYILSEHVAVLHSPLRQPRYRIFEIIDAIRKASYTETIHIDRDIDEAAWNLCKQRIDKPWSLVDCSSFVIMQRHEIQTALTTDHHFEQAGFIRLLKP